MKNNRLIAVLAIVGAVILVIGITMVVVGIVRGGLTGIITREKITHSTTWDPDDWDDGDSRSSGGWSKYWSTVGDRADTLDGTITSLDLSFSAARITVEVAEQGGYDIRSYPVQYLDITFENGTLRIADRYLRTSGFRNVNSSPTMPTVTIYVTQEQLDRLRLEMGAGRLNLAECTLGTLNIEAGAVELNIDRATLGNCEVSIGAGDLTFTDCTVESIDVETGAGRLTFSGDVTRSAAFSGGAGDIKLTLYGALDQYYFDCSRGIGSLSINGKSAGGIGDFQSGDRNAPVEINIATGVGSVEIHTAR